MPTKFSKDCSFAQKIKLERERIGITQAECAVILGVSPRAIWQWEQGQEPIALTQEGALHRLARKAQGRK